MATFDDIPRLKSAVHIRPMTPSYTPPQFSLPGIRVVIRCQFIILARKDEPTPDYARPMAVVGYFFGVRYGVPGTTVPGTTVPGTTVPGTTVPGTTPRTTAQQADQGREKLREKGTSLISSV